MRNAIAILLVIAGGIFMWSQREHYRREGYEALPLAARQAVCVAEFSQKNDAAEDDAQAVAMRDGGALEKVAVPTKDGRTEFALFRAAPVSGPAPLVVSLHQWSGDYSQTDPMAAAAARRGLHYIHPDIGGRMGAPGACCGEGTARGVDAAIDYAMAHASVDPARIYLYGLSGGGYAALCALSTMTHEVAAASVWAPVTDLESWYYQTLARAEPGAHRYDRDILACTGSGATLDRDKALSRSPLHLPVPSAGHPGTRIDLYAGVNDGIGGSVPITHAISYYNRFAGSVRWPWERSDAVTDAEILRLMERRAGNAATGRIADRAVFLHRKHGNLSLTVFDGGHEALPEYALETLERADEK